VKIFLPLADTLVALCWFAVKNCYGDLDNLEFSAS